MHPKRTVSTLSRSRSRSRPAAILAAVPPPVSPPSQPSRRRRANGLAIVAQPSRSRSRCRVAAGLADGHADMSCWFRFVMKAIFGRRLWVSQPKLFYIESRLSIKLRGTLKQNSSKRRHAKACPSWLCPFRAEIRSLNIEIMIGREEKQAP